MKKFPFLRTSVLFSVIILLWSCQKESLQPKESTADEADLLERGHHQHRKPLKGHLTTYFNFIPDVANGWTAPNPAPAWYPGGGNGNITHIGTCQTFFNQYVTFGATGLLSGFAPLNMFFSSELAAVGITVPNTVSTIFFNDKGQSVWTAVVGFGSTNPVSATRVEFTSNLNIFGGTGKFRNANGTFIISGYFNPQNPQDAGFDVDGWIEY